LKYSFGQNASIVAISFFTAALKSRTDYDHYTTIAQFGKMTTGDQILNKTQIFGMKTFEPPWLR